MLTIIPGIVAAARVAGWLVAVAAAAGVGAEARPTSRRAAAASAQTATEPAGASGSDPSFVEGSDSTAAPAMTGWATAAPSPVTDRWTAAGAIEAEPLTPAATISGAATAGIRTRTLPADTAAEGAATATADAGAGIAAESLPDDPAWSPSIL